MGAMARTADKPLLFIALFLFIAGLFILTSASMVTARQNFGNFAYYALRQLLYGGAAGIVALGVASKIPYRFWKTMALPLMLFSLFLLALLFIPDLSYAYGGARRWLRFGSFSFQPSEVAKFAFIVYLASWLDARREEIRSISYGMIPFGMMLGVVGVLLVMQPDIGTLVVIVTTAILLYFLGGGRISQIAALAALGLTAFYFLVQFSPYRLARVLVFLNPGLDPQGVGYQANQAFIAIGSGGFFGRGFARGLQKYFYLPEPMGDSIFAIFAEETGFLGVAILISCFGALLWRGFAIARRAPDIFGKLLAAGISLGIAVQAFINMAAISGFLPLTGIPLPFVSYGSTSLTLTLGMVGILLNISRYTSYNS
jgi:cell division protein FtsW